MSGFLSNSLFLRIASALVLIPLVLCALLYSPQSCLILIGVAFVISCYEWVRMAKLLPHHVLYIVAGLAYIVIGFYALTDLRMMYRNGAGLILSLLISIWASDSGAYFAGKTIGGPKMAPAISPNKTWAGLFGGMLSSALALFLYGQYLGPELNELSGMLDYSALETLSIPAILVLGASLTIVGQIGDLLISYFKRKVGVKDTGRLIPGHGGILDRIDSLLLAGPVFLIVLKLFGIL